ncbi:MAG TPA: NAD(P)-binding domain-containing protein, partial [Chthoniobacterales bacterium]|nr:NAD(P)-binding domain-containing protein [Chthoniobacterales bacterium]
MKSPRIGFVGVGRMGANMARRLKEVGYVVSTVFDTNQKIAAELAAELSCSGAKSVSEVSRDAEAVFTVVTDDAAMRAIYFGPDNLFTHAAGRLFVNCATISPSVHREVAHKGAELGAKVLEAPMASSVTHAREGKLFMMLAGSPEAVASAEPILKDLTL